MDALVSTDWLERELGASDLRVVDATKFLGADRDARAEYEAGHIPGAVSAKQILRMQGLIANSVVRLPLVEPTAVEMEPVLTDLAEAGWDFSAGTTR